MGFLIGLVMAMTITGDCEATEQDYSWDNISNISLSWEVEGLFHSSLYDTIGVVHSQKIDLWGMENHTLTRTVHVKSWGGYKAYGWNDAMSLMAWAHGGSDTDDNWDRDIVVFDLDGGLEFSADLVQLGFDGNDVAPSLLSWRPTTDQLAIVADNGEVIIIDTQNGSSIYDGQFDGRIKLISWDSTGSMLAIVINDIIMNTDSLVIVDIGTGSQWSPTLEGYQVHDIDWSHDGNKVFMMRNDGPNSYDIKANEILDIDVPGINAFASARSNPHLAINGKVTIFMYDYEYNVTEILNTNTYLSGISGWSVDGSYFFIMDENNVIRIWTRVDKARYRPSIQITSPEDVSVVAGDIFITGRVVTDYPEDLIILVKISRLDWMTIDGDTDWTYPFDTSSVPDGMIIIRVKAIDPNGESNIDSVRLFVSNEVPPPPNEPPTIWIDTPFDGSVVWSVVNISGGAADDKRVQAVQMRFNDARWESIPVSEGLPLVDWSYYMDLSYEDPSLEIHVRSYDGMRFSETKSITIVVERPENLSTGGLQIRILYPTMGIDVPSEFTIRGTMSGGVPEEIFIGMDQGPLARIEGTDIWSYEFTNVRIGLHYVRAMARNGTSISTWEYVTFTVVSGVTLENTPPRIGIITPTRDAFYSGPVEVRGWSLDDHEVLFVELRTDIDDEWTRVEGVYEWRHSVNPSGISSGWIQIEVRAYDGDLYSEINTTKIYYSNLKVDEDQDLMYIMLFAGLFLGISVTASFMRLRQRKGLPPPTS